MGSGMGQPALSLWERCSRAVVDWIPYLTLVLSTILSLGLTRGGQSWAERGLTAALVALAATWVYGMYTRAPAPRRAHPRRMAVYFAGLLVIASLLMSRQPFFFVFM